MIHIRMMMLLTMTTMKICAANDIVMMIRCSYDYDTDTYDIAYYTYR